MSKGRNLELVSLKLVDSVQCLLIYIGGQWSVAVGGGILLAVAERPLQELLNLGLGAVLVDQQESEASDRLAILRRCVRIHLAEVRRQLDSRSGRRRRLDGRLHERARRVLNGGVRDLILVGVGQLDVTDRARRLLDQGRYTRNAFARHTSGPLHRLAFADRTVPIRADLAQIGGEDVGGSGTIGTVHWDDRNARQLYAGIKGSYRGVIPILDLAGKDVGNNRAGQLQAVRHALD